MGTEYTTQWIMGRDKGEQMAAATAQNRGLRMRLDTFGKRLRLLRQDRSLSQLELRDKMEKEGGVEIGGAYISELERGDQTPTVKVAAAMAKVLDASLDYLGMLHDDASATYRREAAPVYFSQEADEVAQLVDRMHPSQREVLLSVAKNMMAAPTPRQGRRWKLRDVLDSIERDRGRDVRDKVEELLRSLGLPIDDDS